MKQANEDGLVGLASGTALGAASMVVRPLEGLLGAAEKLAQAPEYFSLKSKMSFSSSFFKRNVNQKKL